MSLLNSKTLLKAKVPVRIIYGNELASVNHFSNLFKRNFSQKNEVLQHMLLDNTEALDELMNSFSSGSLFGDTINIHLLITQKIAAKQEQKLQQIIQIIHNDCLIITISITQPGKMTWLSKLDKSKCQIIHCSTVFPNKRKLWIQECADDLGITLNSKQASAINEVCEGNLTASYNLLKHCERYGVDALTDLLQDHQQNYLAFELLDHMMKGNASKALAVFDSTVKGTSNAVALASMVGNRIIQLFDISQQLQQSSAQDVWGQQKISQFQIENYKNTVARLSKILPKLAESLHEIDKNQKGLGYEDGIAALRNLVMKVATYR